MYDPLQRVGVDHIPASSLLPDRSLAGRGFYPSSPGDSPPALSLDARGPFVTFAPIVSVCKGSPSASRQPTVVEIGRLDLFLLRRPSYRGTVL